MLSSWLGHPDGRQAPEGHQNDQGAGATTARETATVLVLTESWNESVTGRGRRGKAGTGIGTEGTGGTGKDGDPAALTEPKIAENAGEVAAAAGTEGANGKRKKEMVGMTGAGERTGITIKTELMRGRGPGIRRAEERLMTGGIKTTGRDTETRGRPKGRAGVGAGRGSTKVGERRRAGKESVATAESEREMENSVLTNVAAAKTGVIISASPATTTANTVNADGVRAPSKCPLFLFPTQSEKECLHVDNDALFLFLSLFHSLLVFT